MRTIKSIRRAAVFAGLLAVSGAALSATTTYNGSGTYQGEDLQMTLANGNTITGIRVDTVATISTDPPVLLNGHCIGMGILPVTGKESEYTADFFCTFRHNDNDAFDFRGTDSIDGIVVEIVGGSGRWEGVTGSGSIDATNTGSGNGEFTYEFEMTTP